MKNNQNKNEEYAELLEIAAKKLRDLKNPISRKTEKSIQKTAKSIIEERQKIENLSILERSALPKDENFEKAIKAKRILEGKSILEVASQRRNNIEK